jgi:hypothetical protein
LGKAEKIAHSAFCEADFHGTDQATPIMAGLRRRPPGRHGGAGRPGDPDPPGEAVTDDLFRPRLSRLFVC